MSTRPPTVFAWLIHGTWARRAGWVQEGSPLRRALEEGIPAKFKFQVLSWTGRNRVPDRDAAARELVEAAGRTQGDSTVRIAVAHSHGGNIAAYAAHADPDALDGVVTLNTPFLALVQRDWSVMAVHQVILMLGIGVLVMSLLHLNFLAEAAIGLAIMGAVLGTLFIFRDRMMPAIELVVMDVMRHAPARTRTRVLCISTADDEAFGWLELADALINVPFLLLHRIALPLVFLVLVGAHYWFRWQFNTGELEVFALTMQAVAQGMSQKEAFAHIFLGTPPPLTHVELEALTNVLYTEMPLAMTLAETIVSAAAYFSQCYALLASTSLIASVLLRRVVFGAPVNLRAFLYAVGTRLKVSLTPVFLTNVELRFVQSGKSSWLRHSDAYANPNVLGVITEWVASMVRDRTEGACPRGKDQPVKD